MMPRNLQLLLFLNSPETTFPSGLGAAKSEVHLSSPTAAVTNSRGIDFSKFCFTDFPAFVFFKDSSKPLKLSF
jgi:hypothetical protein